MKNLLRHDTNANGYTLLGLEMTQHERQTRVGLGPKQTIYVMGIGLGLNRTIYDMDDKYKIKS